MKTEQQQLLASLPGFIDTITGNFPDFDTHVMVANPLSKWAGWTCEQPELCGQNGSCGPHAQDYVRRHGRFRQVERTPERVRLEPAGRSTLPAEAEAA